MFKKIEFNIDKELQEKIRSFCNDIIWGKNLNIIELSGKFMPVLEGDIYVV